MPATPGWGFAPEGTLLLLRSANIRRSTRRAQQGHRSILGVRYSRRMANRSTTRFTEDQRRSISLEAQQIGPGSRNTPGGDTVVGAKYGVPAATVAGWRRDCKLLMNRGAPEKPAFVISLPKPELGATTAELPEQFRRGTPPPPPVAATPPPVAATARRRARWLWFLRRSRRGTPSTPEPAPSTATPTPASAPAPTATPTPASAPAPTATPTPASAPAPTATPASAPAPTATPTPASAPAPTATPASKPADVTTTGPAAAADPHTTAAAAGGEGSDGHASPGVRASSGARAHLPNPPRYLSPSGAETFSKCPRKWKFQYVEGLEPIPSRTAQVGSFANKILERVMHQAPEERTVERARSLAKEHWESVVNSDEFVALGLNNVQTRRFKERAWDAITGLWENEDPAGVGVEGTEQDMTVTLGGVPFRGIIDRVERTPDGLVVTDYKPGRKPPDKFMARSRYQMMLQAAAVAEYTRETPVRVDIMHLGEGTTRIAVTQNRIDSALRSLSSTWRAVQTACTADTFKPRAGKLCRKCPYLEMCPPGQAEIARLDALKQPSGTAADAHTAA